MVNISKPPLPPNKPYHRPHNYPKYVKHSNLDAHVRVFKAAIRANSEIDDAILLIYLVLPLEILCLINVTIIWEIAQIVFLWNCTWLFVTGTEKFKTMNKFTCN